MDIVVYLNSGQVRCYSQHDPAVVRGLFTDFHASRLFSTSSLILGSGSSCHFVKTSEISRLDLVTEEPLIPHPTIKDEATVIVDEWDFTMRMMAVEKSRAKGVRTGGVAPGESYLGYMNFQLTGGFAVHVELKRQLQQQHQFYSGLYRLFETGVICFSHPRGGLVILNTHNLVSVDAVPGFSEYPKGSWQVDPQRN